METFARNWPFLWGIHRPPVTRSFDVFFDLRLHKRLGKQSWGWWFEAPSCPLWHHGNVIQINIARVFWYLIRGSLYYQIFNSHCINHQTIVWWLIYTLTTLADKLSEPIGIGAIKRLSILYSKITFCDRITKSIYLLLMIYSSEENINEKLELFWLYNGPIVYDIVIWMLYVYYMHKWHPWGQQFFT